MANNIPPGTRVIAFRDIDKKAGVASIFGRGTYVGDEVPPGDILGPFGPLADPNPKIQLDSGLVVWGCECWWVVEEEELVKKSLQGLQVQVASLPEYRRQAREAYEAARAAGAAAPTVLDEDDLRGGRTC